MPVRSLSGSVPFRSRSCRKRVDLRFRGSTQQFLAIATYADGSERDVTDQAEWRLSNPALAKLIETARLTGAADGSVTVQASLPAGPQAKAVAHIHNSQSERAFSFARDIGGILTKRGCNQAACHGGVKGRGGLKLSASAMFPKDDYTWITKGGVYQVLTTEQKSAPVPRVDLKESASQPSAEQADDDYTSRRRQAAGERTWRITTSSSPGSNPALLMARGWSH